jgi:hypothetical protein
MVAGHTCAVVSLASFQIEECGLLLSAAPAHKYARVQAMGIKLLPPSEKINNSQNFNPILKNDISFQSLNTGNHDMVDIFLVKIYF